MVLFCYGDYETKVGPREFVEGATVALTYSLSEFNFFFNRNQLLASDFLEVLVERGGFAVSD